MNKPIPQGEPHETTGIARRKYDRYLRRGIWRLFTPNFLLRLWLSLWKEEDVANGHDPEPAVLRRQSDLGPVRRHCRPLPEQPEDAQRVGNDGARVRHALRAQRTARGHRAKRQKVTQRSHCSQNATGGE